ncbi:MAG TPA: hypothetical protein VGI16_04165 [Candidatus Acidoferrum sp.]
MSNTTPTPPTAAAITAQPTNQTVTAGQMATFSVTATGTPPLSFQWQMNGANISMATAATFTTGVLTTANSGEQFRVMVSNVQGSVTSTAATLTVNPATSASSNRDVVTYHYDNLRTGQNTQELTLTPANVTSAKFGKLGSFAVQGRVDAQPLYLANLILPGGTKNVLYVVTEHGIVYAFDADSVSGNSSTFLWSTSTLPVGEVTSDDRGCGQVTPEIGITSTPVINRARNAIYVVAMSKNTATNTYIQRLHALDLTNGHELFGGPKTITATFTRGTTTVTFDPKQYKERPGLLEVGGTIYTTWASHCDFVPYTAWIMSYSAADLSQSSVLNLDVNGDHGGIWMSGAAPAADAAGNIYFIVGNGTFDTTLDVNGLPTAGDCGNCYAKISSTAPLKLLDYFTPLNTQAESDADTDFGSGGPLLLPDITDTAGTIHHLAVGSGKDSNIYVMDRDNGNMGKFNAAHDNIYQLITGQLGANGVFSKPSFFDNTVYYCASGDFLKAFPITNGKLAGTPSSASLAIFGFPGATPTISASGATNGIVWVVQNGGNAILHAYDANKLTTELYNSNQAANGRDSFLGNKFITPMIVNGKVYVGTPSSVAVFGLLP